MRVKEREREREKEKERRQIESYRNYGKNNMPSKIFGKGGRGSVKI